MTTARITDIIMNDGTECQIYRDVPVKYLHSESKLKRGLFRLAGEVELEEVTENDIIVVIDAFAIRQRHQGDTRIKRRKLGGYTGADKQFRSLKLVGVIKDTQLFLITEKANSIVEDIAPRMPIRESGVYSAMKRVRKVIEAA